MESVKKGRLRELYDSLPGKRITMEAPKTAFVKELAELTRSHPTTVRAWLYGTQRPDALKAGIIARHLGIPEDELFA